MAEPTAQSSIDIAAPAELVYELVSDVPNTPEWTEEAAKCTWVGGADGPAVGAKFRGVNEHKSRKWPMSCTVTDADPPRRFAFKVQLAGLTTALWRYEIEPTAGGCRITESTVRTSPLVPTMVTNRLLGIADRDRHNQANIEQSLANLKELAEKRAAEQS